MSLLLALNSDIKEHTMLHGDLAWGSILFTLFEGFIVIRTGGIMNVLLVLYHFSVLYTSFY